MTLCNQRRQRNSITLRLLGENTEKATENDVPVSKEQNVAQRLNAKHESIPIGCIENTEKQKNFSRGNVEKSLYLLILMKDELTTFKMNRPKQNYGRIRKQTRLDISATWSVNCDDEMCSTAILRSWLETLSTYMENCYFDFEVNMEAELNEQKHLRNKLSKRLKESN